MNSADVLPTPVRSRWWARRRTWIVAALILGLAAAFTYFNTNIFAAERICNGWTTPAAAADALGGGLGRVKVTGEASAGCSIERTSWLPGRGEPSLTVWISPQNERFPFDWGSWKISGQLHVMSGGTQGSFNADKGTALLPAYCLRNGRTDLKVALDVHSTDGSRDAADLGRFLMSLTKTLTSGPNACPDAGDAAASTAETRYSVPSEPTEVDFEKVCRLPGFRLAQIKGPRGERVLEQTSGSLEEGWYCDVYFQDSAAFKHGDANDPILRMGIVTDDRLLKNLEEIGHDVVRCNGRKVVFLYDVDYFDEQERATASGLPTLAAQPTFVNAARLALHCT